MISKVLVANRGEIAVRAFRAAYELGVGTVAVYPYEDRNSLHRLKADESYQIGEIGHPVRAYLSVSEIVDTARDFYDDLLVSCEILDRWYTDRADNSYTTETGKLFPPDYICDLSTICAQPDKPRTSPSARPPPHSDLPR